MEYLSFIISLIGLWFKTRRKSNKAKFEDYKEKGTEIKKSGKLAKAVKFYEKALDIAEENDQQAEIWALLVYLHTDRAIGASKQYEEKKGRIMLWRNNEGELEPWNFGPGKISSDYKSPPRRELLK